MDIEWDGINSMHDTGDIVENKLNHTFEIVENSLTAINSDIKDLQDEQPIYHYKTVVGKSTTSTSYEELNKLTVENVKNLDVFEITLSMIYNYNATNRSAYFRFSTNNGSSWTEVRKESKDTTDNIPTTYSFPIQATSDGNFVVKVEYKTENSDDTLNVSKMSIIAERKTEG